MLSCTKLLTRITIIGGIVTSFSILTGCASPTRTTLPSHFRPQSVLSSSADSYLNKAQTQQGQQQHHNELNAIAVLLINNHNNAAHQLLAQLDTTNWQPAQQAYHQLLQVFLQLNLNHPQQALQLLKPISKPAINATDKPTRLLFHQIARLCYQRNHKVVASLAQSMLISQINDNQSSQWLNNIWLELQRLSVHTLKQQSHQQTQPQVKAWFQLARIVRQHNTHAQTLVRQINNWQKRHPQHPANQLLPDNLNGQQLMPIQPQKIALLLPQSGNFQNMGQAVQNGLLTALQKQDPSPNISIYDTAQKPIAQVYQQAIKEGANMVMGPLTKPHVKALNKAMAHQDNNVPTVALNYTNQPAQSTYLMEFGLSPQQSASQAADSAWRRGANRFLVIQQQGPWFNKVQHAFQNSLQQKGGRITEHITLGDNPKLQIAQALGVNQSQVRAHYIRNILRKKPIFTPRLRQDIHGIFLLAPPKKAREINPLIKFYYGGNIPIYSTSMIYDGKQQPHKNSDLDPIYFSDLRWILNDHYPSLKKRMRNNWPDSYSRYTKLYAIGFDALTIGEHFNYFSSLPYTVYPGVSGPLYSHNHKVKQLLALGRFRHGQVKFVSE